MGAIAKSSKSGYVVDTDVLDDGESSVETTDAYERFRNMSGDELFDFMQNIEIHYKEILKDTQGLNDRNAMQALIHVLGLHETPIVESDKDFDDSAINNALDNAILYRGLHFSPRYEGTVSDMVDSIKYGNQTFIGDGWHGDGIYFTTSTSYAKDYADFPFKDSTITAYLNKRRTKVIDESTLQDAYSNESDYTQLTFRGNISAYALYKGYNTIRVKGGNGDRNDGDFYIALTRYPLTIRDHTKIKHQ